MSILKDKEIEAQDHVAEYYENVRYALPWSRAYHSWLFSHMIQLVQAEGRVLDAGCGNGLLGEYLKKNEVWGIDISKEMIHLAKERLFDARVGDVEALPYRDNFFDTIFARAIIHHLEDPERGVAELTRVLKPNGRMVLMDTRETLFSRKPRKAMLGGEHFSEIHKNMSEKEYLQMLRKHLVIDKISYIGYIGYTLLGFPDILAVYKFFPFKRILTPVLIWIDRAWALIPFARKMALGIVVVAHKK